MKKNTVFLFCLSIFCCCISELTAKEIIKNIRIKENGKKSYFVMFQSKVEPSLWYCGQVKPQILFREMDNLKIPEISLIKFQHRDLKNPEKLNEGAHFRMSLGLGPGSFAIKELEKKALRESSGKPVKLSPIPFPALRLTLQKPDGKEVELNAATLSGINHRYSSQNVDFSITLGKLEADLLDSLLRGQTGAKYQLYYNYDYIDPLLGGKKTSDKVEQREIEERFQLDEKEKRILPGSRDFDRSGADTAEKIRWQLAGEGFIGFAKFSKTIQDQCIFIEKDPDTWKNVYLTLPAIQPIENLTLNRIDLEVKPVFEKKSLKKRLFTWTPGKNWRDEYGAPLVYARMNLNSNAVSAENLQNAYFQIHLKISSNEMDILHQDFSFPVTTGDIPISNPIELADVLEFDISFLSWSKQSDKGLQGMEFSIFEDDWKSSRSISFDRKSGKLLNGGTLKWLVKKPQANSKLFAEIFFLVADKSGLKKIPWKLNDKDLRSELPALNQIFFDQDWIEK